MHPHRAGGRPRSDGARKSRGVEDEGRIRGEEEEEEEVKEKTGSCSTGEPH